MTMRTRVLTVLGCLVVAAVAVARADRREDVPERTAFTGFPMEIGEWRGQQLPALTPEVLAVLGATDYLTRAYRRPDRSPVGLYVGYWDSQRQGDTIHSPLNCLPGAGWEPVQSGHLTFADPRNPSAGDIRVNRYIIQKGLDRQVVLYWYQSHGRIVASEYWGKFYLMADAVRLNRTDGSIVRVTVPIAATSADAETRAEAEALAFVRILLPQLTGFLPA